MEQTIYVTVTLCVRFCGVGRGRGVDGCRVADDVGRFPTAAASGGGPGTPLSERARFGWYWCGVNSEIGMKHVCPSTGSTRPPGALGGTPRGELPDPVSPLSPSTGAGAEGGSASCCGTDSGSLAAVTCNLTKPEVSVSGVISTGSTSLGTS